MLKVKFEADIHDDGILEIPDEYKSQLAGKHVKLVVVADEAMPEKESSQFSDEYIKQHWREMIYTSTMADDFESSDELRQQREDYLLEKYK
jgi:hypothetical protein